ncbi:MAG: hypothetical protein EPN43_08975, partial [Jatrophihabitans sp.]
MAAAAAALAPVLVVPATAHAAPRASHTHAVKMGTFSFAGLGQAPGAPAAPLAPPHQPMNKTLRHTAAAAAAQVPATPVAAGTGGAV